MKGTLYKGLSRGVLAVRIPCSCIHWGAGLPDPLQLVLWLIICVIPFRFRALRPRVQLEGRLNVVWVLYSNPFLFFQTFLFFGIAADLSCLIFFTVSAHGQFSWELVY